nr:ABC transporter permease [Microvirga pudoricolor]
MLRKQWARNALAVIAAGILIVLAIGAICAPLLSSIDPQSISPARRMRPPSTQFWFGTDNLGRDIFTRVIYGSRVSLMVGVGVAALATLFGTFIGLLTGFNRVADAILSRVMDGLMSIPAILIAIALTALTRASVQGVIIAITIAEIPRVARLVRGVTLTLRDQPFIESARSIGCSTPQILFRHILPNTLAPLIVQASFIGASAILIEATLSFLGAGAPTEIPSWGNIMADGRSLFQISPHIIFFPALFLAITVLAVNIVGDAARDALDPRLARETK